MNKQHSTDPTLTRRGFLAAMAATTVTLANTGQAAPPTSSKEPRLKVSLAQWTLVKDFRSKKLDNLDFAKVASEHGIGGLEYVNQFFMDKAQDQKYLAEMKKRAADHGVQSLLIMCDREGNLGETSETKRKQTVDNHRKWIDAAKFLGCHSIRVNARSFGSWEEQVKLAADGLAKLTEFGAAAGLNVIVENHGGLSSSGKWLVEVIKRVDHARCGTLPDFGNFRISAEESYDSYQGVTELLPYAKGVSIKDMGWDAKGNRVKIDFEKMLKIVLQGNYEGYCGIEYGGYEGLKASVADLKRIMTKLG